MLLVVNDRNFRLGSGPDRGQTMCRLYERKMPGFVQALCTILSAGIARRPCKKTMMANGGAGSNAPVYRSS